MKIPSGDAAGIARGIIEGVIDAATKKVDVKYGNGAETVRTILAETIEAAVRRAGKESEDREAVEAGRGDGDLTELRERVRRSHRELGQGIASLIEARQRIEEKVARIKAKETIPADDYGEALRIWEECHHRIDPLKKRCHADEERLLAKKPAPEEGPPRKKARVPIVFK
jgi:chorismate mutase